MVHSPKRVQFSLTPNPFSNKQPDVNSLDQRIKQAFENDNLFLEADLLKLKRELYGLTVMEYGRIMNIWKLYGMYHDRLIRVQDALHDLERFDNLECTYRQLREEQIDLLAKLGFRADHPRILDLKEERK
jgi:hypothetical protein